MAPIWAQTDAARITFDRILQADREPHNWLTYAGNLLGQRHSLLTQITPSNVKNLELAWFWQGRPFAWRRMGPDPGSAEQKFEATPLVVDGVLYTVQPPNDVVALDATTGRIRWTRRHVISLNAHDFCCGRPNRGLAILGDTLFMGTLDARLVAMKASTGEIVWNTVVASLADPACKSGFYCYSITHAPLVVKDKVIVGTAGGDGPIRGFIAAFDAASGTEAWRFHTIPAEGEPGNETWSGDSWKTGGSGVWTTGAYDPDLNLTYWGTGNPFPASGSTRLGDNLYSNSVVALDADTGALRWHYQFTPHDEQDWDAAQTPILIDMDWQGRPRKVMLWANKNGLLYVLDRTTGEFLMGKPFVDVNWMNGFDEKGRPRRVPRNGDEPVKPFGGTNWDPKSYSPRTGLFYVPSRLDVDSSAVQAFDPGTGERKWTFELTRTIHAAGLLSTASDLLFGGTLRFGDAGAPQLSSGAAQLADGDFYALDARTGKLLWRTSLGGDIRSGPMSYMVGGRQYVAVAAGSSLFAFALPQ